MPDTVTEPLIADEREVQRDGYGSDAEREGSIDINEEDVDESKQVAPGPFIWGLTFCAGVSGLLFGYDTGVISSTLVSIGSDLSSRPLTTLDKSLITSSTSFFALLASPLTGILADTLGRKKVIWTADLLFIIGALWQAWSTSVWGMVFGRSIVGAAVGSASFVVPLYISELAPSPFRGRMVVVSSLFITGGQVVAYVIGWLFSEKVHGWRWMVGLGALPAAVQFTMFWFMPETPRWLVKAGRKDAARRVLGRVYMACEGVDERRLITMILRRVEKDVMEEEDLAGERIGKTRWSAEWDRIQDNFTQLVKVGGNRRALIIAFGFRSPTLTSLSIAVTNFLFTLVAFHYIDRIGRRRILLLSLPVMIIGLLFCAVAFNFLHLPMEAHSVDVRGRADVVAGESMVWPVVILVAMVTYVAGYAVGMGNVPWQQSELFPLSVRSLGSAVATATNWASNTLVGITFLPMMDLFTPVGTFALYALDIPRDSETES
ncbi:general substrate transporter [Lentithecium fluviatile CBS 122367]|uniref:General substrate transporter n=1 Tax=Lentithecium fluviatile CBS 122367 TaxID=1168545 RepID=A0A6G1IGK7_9PLEO|nr:general substrate transporter [Lentithecium fluviatile CBS 122367]